MAPRRRRRRRRRWRSRMGWDTARRAIRSTSNAAGMKGHRRRHRLRLPRTSESPVGGSDASPISTMHLRCRHRRRRCSCACPATAGAGSDTHRHRHPRRMVVGRSTSDRRHRPTASAGRHGGLRRRRCVVRASCCWRRAAGCVLHRWRLARGDACRLGHRAGDRRDRDHDPDRHPVSSHRRRRRRRRLGDLEASPCRHCRRHRHRRVVESEAARSAAAGCYQHRRR